MQTGRFCLRMRDEPPFLYQKSKQCQGAINL